MAVRGLVIAVESYPHLQYGLAPVLPGTLAAADRFRDWLIEVKGAAPADIVYCTEDPDAPGRTADATRAAIVAEVYRLVQTGKDATSELYVFLSGHGLGYSDIDGVRVADLFVCSDFRSPPISGDAVLKIDALQTYLRLCLGPGEHFYFVDCCRNSLTTAEIKAIDLPLVYDRSRLGQPTVSTLYSTQEGAPAGVTSGFGEALLKGLVGTGRSKTWQGAKMEVIFQSLKDFVRSKLPRQPIDGRIDGDGRGLILEISPPPVHRCLIRVEDAKPDDQFVVTVRNIRGQLVGGPRSFVGGQGEFAEVPDDYSVALEHQGKPLNPGIQAIDLYEDRQLFFRKLAPVFAGPIAGAMPMTPLTVVAPAAARVLVKAPGSPQPVAVEPGQRARFDARGYYEIEIEDSTRVTIHRESFEHLGREVVVRDYSQLRSSPLRDALIAMIPGNHQGGTVQFAKSLGDLADQGLDLWLALLGAARIYDDPKDSESLREIPLRDFSDEAPGARPVYLLAGFDKPVDRITIGISDGGTVAWRAADPVPGVPNLFQWYAPSREPGDLISIHIDQRPVSPPLMTVVTARTSNRVAFLTVSAGNNGEIRVQQFALPIRHLISQLHQDMQWRLRPENPLVNTKRMVQAVRQVAAHRSLGTILEDRHLYELLAGKWLDPIMAVFATYELIRRGEADSSDWIDTVIKNLRGCFPELPDTEAIAHLMGKPAKEITRPPVVLEGLLSLSGPSRPRVLPDDRLDYRGPWTAWLNAVAPPTRADGKIVGAGESIPG